MLESLNGNINTIGKLLRLTAEKYGSKPCIKYLRNEEVVEVSYKDFFVNSFKAALYLKSKISERKHIAVIGKTSYEFLIYLNAVYISGNVAVVLSDDRKMEDTVSLLKDSDSEVLLYGSSIRNHLDFIQKECPMSFTLDMEDENLFADICSKEYPTREFEKDFENPEDCASIIYTSGTSGVSKGAMLSSNAIVSNVFYREMSFEGEHVALNVLPLHHIFSFSCDYLKNLKDGVTICLNGDISNINSNLLLFEPSFIRLVPMMVETLVRRMRIIKKNSPELSPREAAERVFGKNLRNIIASGAKLNAVMAKELEEAGITIRQGYGMTETGPRISVPDGKTCADSGGRVISICNVRIENGEIQVQSPSLMMGYYKKSEETAKVFTQDGWFRTGDIGYMTPDRELFITGRLKNIIVLSNGENVSPEEIEKNFSSEQLIKEILVFEEKGKIAADIYPDYDYAKKNGITDIDSAVNSIVDKINSQDIDAREIARIHIKTEPLPKTSTGKIIREKGE
ncbi:MAG: AMP-binding protein [Clostridia bacterium]|nr:AMP-binding protein [Clostridia bacterium]